SITSTQNVNLKDTNATEEKIELVDVKKVNDGWLRVYAKETVKCLEIIGDYDAVFDRRAGLTPEDIERQLNECADRLTAAIGSLETDELRSAMKVTLAIWKRDSKLQIAEI